MALNSCTFSSLAWSGNMLSNKCNVPSESMFYDIFNLLFFHITRIDSCLTLQPKKILRSHQQPRRNVHGVQLLKQ